MIEFLKNMVAGLIVLALVAAIFVAFNLYTDIMLGTTLSLFALWLAYWIGASIRGV